MQFSTYQRVLLLVHSAFMLLAAGYVSFMYPMAWPACLILSASGISVALMPLRWRQRAIGEVTYLLAAIIASAVQWYLHGQDAQSIQGLSRIILVSLVLVLVPNRPGQVRSLAMLIALELLLLDRLEAVPEWLFIALSAIAMSALFLDAWLRLQNRLPIGVRIRNRQLAQPWLPLIVCLLILITVCLPLSYAVQDLGQQHRFRIQSQSSGTGNDNNTPLILDERLQLGSDIWSDQDSTIIARYIPDREELINERQSTYIRGMCVPRYQLEGNGLLSWEGPANAVPYTGEQIADIPLGSGATLLRYRTPDRIVLRPDGSSFPVIDNFFFDSEGNIYSQEQDLGVNRYRCEVSRASYARTQTNAQRDDDTYLSVPNELLSQFQQQIPQLEQWRVLGPRQAAKQIQLYLQRQCRYQTKNLPQVEPSPAACMSVFLFGSREQRVGHCQYFASAAAFLLRSCGHATRPVFGFASNEVDDSGSRSLILRAWHAHAWVEFINDSGNWQRLDCTPPDYLTERIRGAKLPSEQHDPETIAKQEESQSFSWRPYALLFVSISLAGCIFWLVMRNKSTLSSLNERQRQLAAQEAALINCASKLGIQVKDSHTLTYIVRAIERVSGMELSRYLGEHLAARYNNDLMTHDWPIAQITAAVQARKSS